MSKITRFKRALAVLMSLVLLFSAMAVAGVSAAVTGTAYHYTFDNTADNFDYNSKYFSGSHIHNAYNHGGYGVATLLTSGGYNGSSQAMKMAYTADLSAQETKWHAAFSLPNNTTETLEDRNPEQTAHLVAGGTYEISVTYKVTGYRSAAALYYAQGMGALASNERAEFAQCNPLKLADITGTTSDWNTARVILPSAVKTGGYIVLKMVDDTNRAGTEVLIGKVDVVPIDPSAKITVTFDSDGGSAVSPVIGDVGTSINYPAAPTKNGYTFVGWFTAGGEAAPATFPSSNITLIARWSDPTVWGFESEPIGTSISVAHHHHATNKMTPTNEAARSGLASARVDSKYTDGNLRAQMLLKDAQGQTVTVQQGKTYDVSFWVMVPASQQNVTLVYWLTATPDGDPFDANRTVDGVPYVKNNFVLDEVGEADGPAVAADGQWVKVAATLDDVARSGQLRLGIADSSNNQESYFYIDDIKVTEKVITPAEEGVWNFESETVGTPVSVAHIQHATNKITPTNEAAHTGSVSARVDSKYTDGNLRSQMILKDAQGQTVTVQQGKTYDVSFWVMVPASQQNVTLVYWLTATPDGDPFDANRTVDGVPYVKNNFVLDEVGEADGPAVAADGQWVQVTATLDNVARSGQLRLGIADTSNNQESYFYIDDIKVKQAGEVITDGFVMQDFESFAAGDALHINDDPRPTINTTIVTTDEIAGHSGTQTAKVTSNTNNGNIRPQMMVKDAGDNQFKVYKGRNYEVKFWVYMPVGMEPYDFGYWLAATPDAKSFNTVDYLKNDYKIAEPAEGIHLAVGQWTEITVPINDCSRSGLLRLGLTCLTGVLHSFYIDDISVREVIAPVATGVNSFETHTDGDILSINTDGNVIAAVDSEHHTGSMAAAVNSFGNGVNTVPQMLLTDAEDALVTVEAGKKYSVEFWVMLPERESDYDLQYWLAATDSDVPFSDTNERTGIIADTSVVTIAEKSVWQRVNITIDNCAAGGKLRLGISGTAATQHSFYIDDVKVEELISIPADENAWSFETEPIGTAVSVLHKHHELNSIITTDEAFHTGSASARVNCRYNDGNYRPQMMVKDAAGEQVNVELGKSYQVTFWVMVPEGQPDLTLKYWLAATPNGAPFDSAVMVDGVEYVKNNFVLYEDQNDGPTINSNGEWVQVMLELENASRAGQLRLGITDHLNGTNTVFYIDDIKVKVSGGLITDGFEMQDFESYAVGDEIDLNNPANPNVITTIVVSDEIEGHSGSLTAKFSSTTNSGNARPQMMVKDALGRQFKVYKGRNYEIKFWVFMPANSESYGFSYWLAASDDTVCFDGVNRKKDDFVISEVSNGSQPALGRWTEITMTINDCRLSGLLRLGITGHHNVLHSFYIDDITVTELLVTPEEGVNSFESNSDGDKLSINTDANTIIATNIQHHTGSMAAQVNSTGNGVNGAPQMMLADAYGNQLKAEAGKQYKVSFWVMVPDSEADYDIQYWLAATRNEKPFSDNNNRSGVIVDTATVKITEKGVWQRVNLIIDNCAADGKVRLGISGSAAQAHTFYIDDVMFEELVIVPADPDAMNFENYTVGERIEVNDDNKNYAVITDEEAYTGTQSAYFHAFTSAGDARPQINVTDADGNPIKLEKGEDYYISFKVLMSEDVEFSYWATCVPDDMLNEPFRYGDENGFIKNNYVVMENSRHVGIFPGDWTEVRVPITDCQYSGNLRVGFTHYAANNKDFYFYIDDIKVEPPQYVLVKFDANGAEGDYPDKLVMSGSTIFTEDDIMPYRNGYEFMGWYTNKECTKDAYFDAYTTPVVGDNGDVLTLYASWREWDNADLGGSIGDREEQQTLIEYKTEYYTEQVWVGDQNVPKPLDIGDRPGHKEAAPIVTPSDKVGEDETAPLPEDGMPPWLIVVIIVTAVVIVGGGAVIAALLIKKSKKA